MSEEEEADRAQRTLEIGLLISSTFLFIWYVYWYSGILPHASIPSEFWNLVIIFGPWVAIDLCFSFFGNLWSRKKDREDKERQEQILNQIRIINLRLNEMSTQITCLIQEMSKEREERKQG